MSSFQCLYCLAERGISSSHHRNLNSFIMSCIQPPPSLLPLLPIFLPPPPSPPSLLPLLFLSFSILPVLSISASPLREGREGGRKGGKKGGKKGGREGGREGRREGEREGRRKGGRNGGYFVRGSDLFLQNRSLVYLRLSFFLPGAAQTHKHLILQSGQLESHKAIVFGIQVWGGSVGREV